MTGLHQVQNFHRQRTRPDPNSAGGHHICNAQRAHVNAHIKDATQITVGEDAFDLHQVVANDRHTEIFTGDFQQRITQRGIFADVRDFRAGVHNIIHAQQKFTSQRTAWVREGKIFGGKTTRFEQRHGEGIAHHQRRSGAGRRRQAERAGLLRDFHTQVNIRRTRHAALRATGHANEGNVQTLEHRDQRQDFVGFTGVRQRNHHVLRRDHSEIAMGGFTRMDEEGRRSGTGEGRGHLTTDVTGFAHPHHHDFTGAGGNLLTCLTKVLIYVLI
ncbi:hypothetical protein D3C72_1132280 [compost metagenome]